MPKFTGLLFKKFDLHVHTPASHDYENKQAKPEELINEALKKGLSGIAITDHHSAEWIDKMKAAVKGKNLVIFPGIEICCTGGESGIHIIGIWDTDKDQKHIESILSQLEIKTTDWGTKNAVTSKAPGEVIDKIAKNEGIAILAHCTSSKGVLHDMKGAIRTKVFEHSGMLAVETSENDFLDVNKENKKKRVIDLLNGKDENFSFRKLGVYQAIMKFTALIVKKTSFNFNTIYSRRTIRI